jgi:hypothetical protein
VLPFSGFPEAHVAVQQNAASEELLAVPALVLPALTFVIWEFGDRRQQVIFTLVHRLPSHLSATKKG